MALNHCHLRHLPVVLCGSAIIVPPMWDTFTTSPPSVQSSNLLVAMVHSYLPLDASSRIKKMHVRSALQLRLPIIVDQ